MFLIRMCLCMPRCYSRISLLLHHSPFNSPHCSCSLHKRTFSLCYPFCIDFMKLTPSSQKRGALIFILFGKKLRRNLIAAPIFSFHSLFSLFVLPCFLSFLSRSQPKLMYGVVLVVLFHFSALSSFNTIFRFLIFSSFNFHS